MILNNGFNNSFKNNFNLLNNKNNYDTTIKNLEKALEILEDRYSKKQISDEEYIKKSKEIKSNIDKYKNIANY